MLALGHAGITLGMAVLVTGMAVRDCSAPVAPVTVVVSLPGERRRWRRLTARLANWFDRLAARVDLRVLLIGSLLPDVIDKPLGHLFLRDTFSSGRIFGHTLVFLLLISLAGLFLYRRAGRTWLLALAFGTATHLLFDQMWDVPRTLLWPAYGVTFERGDLTDWIPGMLRGLVMEPKVYVPELVGAAVLAAFILALVQRKRVRAFLRHGRT
jgi:inner membrane protein